MAFDQSTRNRLQHFVSDAKTLLIVEFTRQLQNEYGLNPETGEVSDLSNLSFLDDARRETAGILRETMEHYLATTPGAGNREVLSRIVWEQAFTILNRMAALRMAEARGFLMESIGNGYQSKGFQLYSYVAKSALGESGDAYRHYIFSIFDEFSLDLKVLFDRFSPQGRLFPKESKFMELLDLINHPDIEHLWAEDETIGWIYQYFNSKEERKKMRDASKSPRNSRELAVRNQFFTPRYVVEFLTDNTLGRIWYEMTQGKTSLIESCRYLVRRPNEFFLNKGENASEPEEGEGHEELSQEELLKQPVHVTFRQIKDPRDLKMLDPACGSMHFGLYAFDLFEKIYDEAWDIEGELGAGHFEQNKTFNPLHESYENKEFFLQDVPRLIIENNIHGVDIDPRAVQIAGLSLWLRAQKSWHEMGITAANRPQIQKSNIVCAEPMPGEENLLKEFTANLKPRVIGQLVEIIFEKMKLAGEAGSLLKIEEEIQDAIKEAREEYSQEILQKKGQKGFFPGMAPTRQPTLFDFADLPDDEAFWDQAENKILDALRDYAEHAEGGNTSQKRLFAQDAAKGFAFIDLCRKRFDVVLMNPPYGEVSIRANRYINQKYSFAGHDIFLAFIQRAQEILLEDKICGALTSRNFMFNQRMTDFRKEFLLSKVKLKILIDMGSGVLDAVVDVAAFTFVNNDQIKSKGNDSLFLNLNNENNKQNILNNLVKNIILGEPEKTIFCRSSIFLKNLPGNRFSYSAPNSLVSLFSKYDKLDPNFGSVLKGLITGNDERYVRQWFECPNNEIETIWKRFHKGGDYSPFYSDIFLVVFWGKNGNVLKADAATKYGNSSRTIKNEKYYGIPGIGWSVNNSGFGAKAISSKSLFADIGPVFQPTCREQLYGIISFMNSQLVKMVLRLFQAGNRGRFMWIADIVQQIPCPQYSLIKSTSDIGKKVLSLFLSASEINETSPIFFRPFHRLIKTEPSLNEHFKMHNSIIQHHSQLVQKLCFQIDEIVAQAYGISFDDAYDIENLISENEKPNVVFLNRFKRSYLESVEFQISYILGCIFGRWDIRYTNGEKNPPKLYDAFDPLPVNSPGRLQKYLKTSENIKENISDYPLRINMTGVIVIDEGHSEDIITRIREAIKVVWEEKASDIELEACEILNTSSLHEYFSKPNKFFSGHLRIYSKGRRQSPIYWPLSTKSGSYVLWVYYHRLSDQILYTCINNFVEPKLKEVAEDVEALRQKTSRSTQEEKDLEKLTSLELELTDLRDELLRIAKFWKPNLNDGVQITAAPLWKLFQYKPWQKKLKQTWEKLEKGEYDWAHLAHSIWPERVREKCKTDKSLAIAHDLEDLYEEPPAKPKKKRCKKNPVKG